MLQLSLKETKSNLQRSQSNQRSRRHTFKNCHKLKDLSFPKIYKMRQLRKDRKKQQHACCKEQTTKKLKWCHKLLQILNLHPVQSGMAQKEKVDLETLHIHMVTKEKNEIYYQQFKTYLLNSYFNSNDLMVIKRSYLKLK